MIKVAIVKGLSFDSIKKDQLTRITLSNNGDITSINDGTSKKTNVLLEPFAFEAIDVPLDQEVIDTYHMINQHLSMLFQKKEWTNF